MSALAVVDETDRDLIDYCHNRFPARVVAVEQRRAHGSTSTSLLLDGLTVSDPNAEQWDAAYHLARRFGLHPGETRWEHVGDDERGLHAGRFVFEKQHGMRPATDVFVSDLLKARHPSFHAHLVRQLRRFALSVREIEGTRDIWCRDYMPVVIGGGRFVQFRYAPDYLASSPELVTPPEATAHVVSSLTCSRTELLGDGGSIIRHGKLAVVTEKLASDNPTIPRGQLIDRLRELLHVERIVMIATEPGDILGHADGVLALLDDRTALVNDYSAVDPGYGARLGGVLRDHQLEAVPMPYVPDLSDTRDIASAIGVYVNLLQTAESIFVPTYGVRADDDAVRLLEKVSTRRSIVPVDCRAIADEGGSLHCVTWRQTDE